MWLRKKPELVLGLELFYTAFSELNTCRTSGWHPGPIPFTAIVDYARAFDFNERQAADLVFLIREMDRAYLQFADKKMQTKPKGGKIGVS